MFYTADYLIGEYVFHGWLTGQWVWFSWLTYWSVSMFFMADCTLWQDRVEAAQKLYAFHGWLTGQWVCFSWLTAPCDRIEWRQPRSCMFFMADCTLWQDHMFFMADCTLWQDWVEAAQKLYVFHGWLHPVTGSYVFHGWPHPVTGSYVFHGWLHPVTGSSGGSPEAVGRPQDAQQSGQRSERHGDAVHCLRPAS